MNRNNRNTRKAKRPRLNNTAAKAAAANNYMTPLKNSSNNNAPANNTRRRIKFNSSVHVRPINKEGRSVPVGNQMKTGTRGPAYPSGNVSNRSTRNQFIASAVGYTAENRLSYNQMANIIEGINLDEELRDDILNKLYRHYHNFTGNNNASTSASANGNTNKNNASNNNAPANQNADPLFNLEADDDELFNVNIPPWARPSS